MAEKLDYLYPIPSPPPPEARISVKLDKARALNCLCSMARDESTDVISRIQADFADRRDSGLLLPAHPDPDPNADLLLALSRVPLTSAEELPVRPSRGRKASATTLGEALATSATR